MVSRVKPDGRSGGATGAGSDTISHSEASHSSRTASAIHGSPPRTSTAPAPTAASAIPDQGSERCADIGRAPSGKRRAAPACTMMRSSRSW